MIKRLLRSVTPKPLLNLYHLTLSKAADFFYGHPSKKLVVIGVTGTNGKSSVVNFIGQMLQSAGETVGWTSTATINTGKGEQLNDTKMTMLGRFQLQRSLLQMLKNGCTHAVVETSSEGIKQHRHAGIHYDIVVFTNLTPEHIESHGGFENYKNAKRELFRHLSTYPRKVLQGREIPKVMVVNGDDPHAKDFVIFPADKKILFTVDSDVEETSEGLEFRALQMDMTAPIIGKFNVSNILAAISVAKECGLSPEQIQHAVFHLKPVPGRLEKIEEGQDFTVIVDYSPEPQSMQTLYDVVVTPMAKKRVIHVFGSCGGGRDKARRPILGGIAGKHADVCIVTNEDPYDEDPRKIMDEVALGARQAGKRDGEDLFIVEDRGEAIASAIQMAEKDDLVLITGKACEQAICVKDGKKIPWDDRTEARAALKTYGRL